MRHFLWIISAAGLLLAGWISGGPGDLNGDDEVNILDVIALINLIMESEQVPDEDDMIAGDLNFDGSLDVMDVVILVNGILGVEPLPDVPRRILFIGNSYTASNGGIGPVTGGMADVNHENWNIMTDQITQGGATLEMHFQNENTLETIESGSWDIVVLQEQSTRPLDDPELFAEYAALLDSVIQVHGGSTVLFMTLALEYYPDMILGLSEAYTAAGETLSAAVAPVGLAFEAVRMSDPEFELYQNDGSHPNQAGTYLAACVFYAVFWEESPAGLPYSGSFEISEDDCWFLQTTAWQTVTQYLSEP